jgi:hypothetical protein
MDFKTIGIAKPSAQVKRRLQMVAPGATLPREQK